MQKKKASSAPSSTSRKILDYLSKQTAPQTPTRIAAETRLNKNTVRRELQTLLKKSLIEKDEKHTYRLKTRHPPTGKHQDEKKNEDTAQMITPHGVKADTERIRKKDTLFALYTIQRLIDTGQVSCPKCGGKELTWSCCRKKVLDSKLMERLKEEVTKP